jgi:3-oxoacyl-[acyl-carrier protein] reductase
MATQETGAEPGSEPGPLAGQVALITGAGRGIGRHLATGLAAEGVRVGLLGRHRDSLEQVLRECVKLGPRCVAVPADVVKEEAVRAAVQTVQRDLGPIDLLINNAGRIESSPAAPWQANSADWWAVMEANLRGPFHVCRAALPEMIERGCGRIINVASGFGTRPVPDYSAYSVSKAAAMRFTDILATSLRDSGVSVFDVSPGAVRTDMTADMPMFAGFSETDWTPVERMVGVVRAVAQGRLDPLSGRFVHAGKDDLDTLLAQAERIRAGDARALRLVPYGPNDPLG